MSRYVTDHEASARFTAGNSIFIHVSQGKYSEQYGPQAYVQVGIGGKVKQTRSKHGKKGNMIRIHPLRDIYKSIVSFEA